MHTNLKLLQGDKSVPFHVARGNFLGIFHTYDLVYFYPTLQDNVLHRAANNVQKTNHDQHKTLPNKIFKNTEKGHLNNSIFFTMFKPSQRQSPRWASREIGFLKASATPEKATAWSPPAKLG